MRSTPTVLRRLGASTVAGAALIAAGAVVLAPAFANHTASNGGVTSGPDVVMVDCVAPNRTTSTGAHPSPQPTNSSGRNPQAAATGSGCTVQAPTGRTVAPNGTVTQPASPSPAYTVRARFTFNGTPVPNRTIQFTSTGPSGQSIGSPSPTPNPSPGTTSTTVHFCSTNAEGECSIAVRSTTVGTVTVTATEQGSGESATENVEFRDNSTRVDVLDETHRTVVKPNEDDYTGFNCEGSSTTPYSGTGGTAGTGDTNGVGGNGCPNTSSRAPSGTPGRPVQVTYQLFDEGVNAGTIPLTNPQVGRRSLTNRTVRLTLSVPGGATPYFFTPNCGAVVFNGGTTPNAPDYRSCSFRNSINDGAPAGLLNSLGLSQVVTSDDNGLVTVTIATDTNTELNNDGLASVIVSLTGEPGFDQAGQGGRGRTVTASEGFSTSPAPTTDPNDSARTEREAPVYFNTRNRPLNGVQVQLVSLDSPVRFATVTTRSDPGGSGSGGAFRGFSRSFRPINATTQFFDVQPNVSSRFAVYLYDQFNNLVRVPESDTNVSAAGPGVFLERECRTGGTGTNGANFGSSVCSNPAAANTNFGMSGPTQPTCANNTSGNPTFGSTCQDRTTGSYQTSSTDYRNVDPFRVTSTTGGQLQLSATWQAPQTVFNGSTGFVSSSPTVNPTTAGPTATATASPTVSPSATASPTASATASPTVSPTTTASPTTSPTSTPPPTRFASRVSLVTSHSRITAGNGPRLTGQVFDQNGQPLAGVNVTIFEKSFGESFYSPTPRGQLTSGFDGRFSLVVNPISQTSFGANTDDGRANSNIVQIRVNARMDITSPAPSALVSNPVTLSGQILPAYNNRLIGLAYINSRGQYVFLGQSPTQSGRFSVRSGGRVPAGTYTFVVYMSPTQGTDRGARSLRLTVR